LIRTVVAISRPIDIAAVAYPDHLDNQSIIEDLVDDAVVANPDAVDAPFALGLRRARWSGLLGQEVDGGPDPLLLTSGKACERADGPAGNLDPIAAHARPRSAFTSSQGT